MEVPMNQESKIPDYENAIEIKNLTKKYDGFTLDNVSFNVPKGSIMGFIGQNGAGKTTTINSLLNILNWDSGEIRLLGQDMPEHEYEVKEQIAAIFDVLPFNDDLSAKQLTRMMRGIWKEWDEDTFLGYLERFQLPFKKKFGQFSKGMKMKLQIAAGLSHKAKLLIMDEPTTALTKKEVDALFTTVRQLRDSGIAIMFISHKTEEIFEISDDVCIMRNGKNVHSGPTAELTPKKFTYYMTGRELTDDRFVPKNVSKEPVLKVNDLTLKNKFENVSFELRKGEILGITGLLGSGRTELALSLFGLEHPQSGTITLNGQQVTIKSPVHAQKLKIGYVPEDRLTEGLCLQQPIADNITLSSLKRLSNAIGLLKHQDLIDDAGIWKEKFSIATDDVRKLASTLSGGNQQKIVLSKWLSNDLDVLILNGPTVGVDVGAKQDIHALVHELANQGLAVIIISDDLSEVVINCSRVIVMKEGRIVGEMAGDEVTENNILEIIR